jgi:hypothetical protein
MNPLIPECFYYFLAESTNLYSLFSNFWHFGNKTHNISLSWVSTHTEEEVGAGQVEKMKRMGLNKLRHVN